MKTIETVCLFSYQGTLSEALLSQYTYPWEALPHLRDYIIELGATLDPSRFEEREKHIWVARSASVAASAMLCAPLILDEETEVRHCAYLRGSVLACRGAVIGNSCEVKNAMLLNGAQLPHFNYCGDSILGARAHMAGGVITSNVKGDRTPISVHTHSETLPTGLRKFGAMLGDDTEIGCGTVLNPGTVVGRGSRIYPMSSLRGVIPAGVIYKTPDAVVRLENREV